MRSWHSGMCFDIEKKKKILKGIQFQVETLILKTFGFRNLKGKSICCFILFDTFAS